MYTETTALAWFRTQPWFTSRAVGDPLAGLYDGVNKVFKAQAYPVVSNGASVYINTSSGITGVTGAWNYDSGRFTAGSPPLSQPYADYQAQVMTDGEFTSYFRRGFDEMQVRYRRTALHLESVTGALAVTDGAAQDPVVGGEYFSESPIQTDYLLACVELAIYRGLAVSATSDSLAYREERVGGLSIDASRRARDYNDLIARQDIDVDRKCEAVRMAEGDEDDFGVFIPGPRLVNGVWV